MVAKMKTQPIENVLFFIKEIDLLKNVERQTLTHNGARRENTAEHSWHLAMAVFAFQDFAPAKLDLNKAIKLALIHDLVEIYAGDTFVYADLSKKKSSEEMALQRLKELLPDHLAQDLSELWHEHEDRSSLEAKYVSALDRFLPLYANFLNGGYSWKNHNVTSSQVYERNQKHIYDGIPALWEYSQKIISESIEKGFLKK